MTATVTLLSDFIDGTSMALMEETDAEDLNAFMTASQGRLWGDVQKKRRAKGLTSKRLGPGTLYFCSNEEGLSALQNFLESETNSKNEQRWLDEMRKNNVQIAPHVGSESERRVLIGGQHNQINNAKGFR